jgi:hypothetical protein
MTFRPALAPSLFPALILAFGSTAVGADPVDTRTARGLLYDEARVEVLRYRTDGLSDEEIETLTMVAQSQKYYAAMAYAPDAGILAEPTVLASNYHTIEAAREAAFRQCNERRSGGAACVIAMEVRPAGWEERDLQLSSDATAAFNDEYRRARGTRAFAVSTASGQWGIGLGDAAQEDALAACAGDADVSDCAVVIVD